jgi:hypothetical protein
MVHMEPEIRWIRVAGNVDLHSGTIEWVSECEAATALSEHEMNYFLGKLRDDPRGYEYQPVAVATPSRFVVHSENQVYRIMAKKRLA